MESPNQNQKIPLKIEFGGGLELLFSNQRSHRISVPSRIPFSLSLNGNANDSDNSGNSEEDKRPQPQPRPQPGPTTDGRPETETKTETKTKPVDINYLLHYLRDNLLKERVELFMENDTIRPGILVLVNDSDWELEGEGDYQLKAGDELVFISTLHGG